MTDDDAGPEPTERLAPARRREDETPADGDRRDDAAPAGDRGVPQPQAGDRGTPQTWSYPDIEGVTWLPLYPDDGAQRHAATWLRWTGLGFVVALVLLVLAVVLVSDDRLGVLGIGAAAIGGLAMVGAGIAWLAGETLRAEKARPAVPDVTARSVTGVAQVPEMFKTLKDGLGGMTAPRALIFAGAFLLAVAAIAGAVAVTGGEGGAAEEQTEEPTTGVTDDPTVVPTE